MEAVAVSMNTYSHRSYILISMHINIPVADVIQKAWQELFYVIYGYTCKLFVRVSLSWFMIRSPDGTTVHNDCYTAFAIDCFSRVPFSCRRDNWVVIGQA